jgi:hypothetical protein
MSSEAPEPVIVDPAKVPGPDGLTPDEREAAKIAAVIHDQNAVAFSDPRTPPMFLFTRLELTGPQARDTIEGGPEHANPYRWLGGWPVPRVMLIQIPHRPEWANFAWLCVVEIQANPQSWAGNHSIPDLTPRSVL